MLKDLVIKLEYLIESTFSSFHVVCKNSSISSSSDCIVMLKSSNSLQDGLLLLDYVIGKLGVIMF